MYIASDETDPQVLAQWRSRGCLVWGDTGLSQSSTGSNADGIFVDIMLLAHAETTYTLGASSVDAVVDAERRRLGKSAVQDVSV